jgi:hypothetical protein
MLATSTPSSAFALAMVGVVVGLAVLIRGLSSYRRASLIADMPSGAISAIAVGENRVSGTIEAAELTLISPLQSEPCVYYRSSVTRENSRSDNRLFSEERAVGFRVRDATGSLRVFPRGAAFDVPDAYDERSGFLGEAPGGLQPRQGPATDVASKDEEAQITALLTVHPSNGWISASNGGPDLGPTDDLGLHGSSRRYREARLAVGDTVTLIGAVLPFNQLDDPDGSDRLDGASGIGQDDPEVAADLAAAQASGGLATSPAVAWGNAAIPGFGIGHPVSTPTLDPAANPEAVAGPDEAARAQRTFDIPPDSLVLASQPGQRLLITSGSPATAVQRADDRFIAGLLGAALAIASVIVLAWLLSGGLG